MPPLPSSTPTATSIDEASTSDMATAGTATDEAVDTAENAGAAVAKPDKDILSMRSLHASIEQEGILTPLLVRRAQRTQTTQTQTGVASDASDASTADVEEPLYEILSGYRRKRVCEVLSRTNPAFSSVPVIVVSPCDDDTASSIITSANVQRREVSFLETIKSCGQMYRALRHRGKKGNNISGNSNTTNDGDGGVIGESGESSEAGVTTAVVISQILGLKPRTVQRYSQLLELPERMLELVGRKEKNSDGVIRLPIRAGEVLSNVSREKLSLIEEVLTDSKNRNLIITENMAKAIRKNCTLKSEISKKEIERIIKEEQHASGQKKKAGKKSGRKKLGGGFILDENRLRKFCGSKMTEKEVREFIYELVEKWSSEGHKAE